MKQLFTWVILLALAITLSNCKDHVKTRRQAGLEFDSISIDTAITLTGDKNAPICALKLDLKMAKGSHADQINDSLLRSGLLVPDYLSLSNMKLTPKEAIDSFITCYFNDYREFYAPIYQKEANKAYGQQLFEVTTSVQGGKEGVTNYIANISIISGEQHTEYTLVKNIEEKSGRLLTLNDIFIKGHDKEIGETILKALANQEGMDTEELLGEGFFASGDAYPSKNFILDDDGITFIYISGEIANRLKGEIQVFVKYSKLHKWMKE